MRENLDQWDFVIACYVVGIVMTLGLVTWSWIGMKREEQRREEAKRK